MNTYVLAINLYA